MFGQTLLVLAALLVFHTAYSAYEHLSHLKAIGRPEESLPIDIVIEALVALVMGTLGASLSAPPLKEITWVSEMKTRTIDDMDSRLGFASYVNRANHGGSAFLAGGSASVKNKSI